MDLGGTEDIDAHDPSLLSNLEVLEFLQKSLAENQPKHKRWKHRDWVQAQVVQYLLSTPCTKLDPSRREEFQSLLQSRKRRNPSTATKNPAFPSPNAPLVASPTFSPPPPSSKPSSSGTPIPDAAPSSSAGIHVNPSPFAATSPLSTGHESRRPPEPSPSPALPDAPDADETKASGFGLTQAEALQVLNFMPTEAVELHLMVEDLESRLTPKQQDGLLEAVSRYTVKPPVGALASRNGDIDMAARDLDGTDKVGDAEEMNGR